MGVSGAPLRIFGLWWELHCSLVPLVPSCLELMLEVCVIVLLDLLIVQRGGAIGNLYTYATFELGHSRGRPV